MQRLRSFEVFYAGERDRLVRALAVVFGDADLAAEAVDEAMARAWQRWDRVVALERPDAWVVRVARNWATSALRWRRLRPVREAEELDRPHCDRRTDVDLADAIADLSSDHRTAVVLRYHLDLSIREIADLLGVAEGTVKSRLSRATGQLAQVLEVER